MTDEPQTVAEYLARLPEDRRRAIRTVRRTIRKYLPKGYREGIQCGMIGYSVPHSLYPAGYHCDPSQPLPFVNLASQKNYMSLHMMCIYSNPALAQWFQEAWKRSGKKLNMGKSCVRFTSVDQLSLEVIGQAIQRVPVKQFIEQYESSIGGARRNRTKHKKTAAVKSGSDSSKARTSASRAAIQKKRR